MNASVVDDSQCILQGSTVWSDVCSQDFKLNYAIFSFFHGFVYAAILLICIRNMTYRVMQSNFKITMEYNMSANIYLLIGLVFEMIQWSNYRGIHYNDYALSSVSDCISSIALIYTGYVHTLSYIH